MKKLRNIYFNLSELIDEYLQVHDEIFANRSFFLGVFKKNSIERDPYEKSKKILFKFASLKDDIECIILDVYPKLTLAQKKYLECLIDYIDALIYAIEVLHKRQSLSIGNNISVDNGGKKIDECYKDAVDKYTNLGVELNSIKNTKILNLF